MAFFDSQKVRISEKMIMALRDAVTLEEIAGVVKKYPDICRDMPDARLNFIVIDSFEKAVQNSLLKSPELFDHIRQLNNKLPNHYKLTDDLEDPLLVQAIDAFQYAVQNTPKDSSNQYCYFKILGIFFYDLYKSTRIYGDFQKSIDAREKAIKIAPRNLPDLPDYLGDLAFRWYDLYKQTREFRYLKQSIEVLEEATKKLHQDSSDLPDYLFNMGLHLSYHYEQTGRYEFLQKSIDFIEQAIQQSHQQSSDLHRFFGELGINLLNRYRCTGSLEDLYQSINLAEKAIEISSDDSPYLAAHFNNFGSALQKLYEHTKSIKVLNQCIETWETSVSKTPQESPDFPRRLNNLGIGFHSRYNHTEALVDLEKAINTWTQAVDMTHPNSPELSRHLAQLAIGLHGKYKITHELIYLEQAIDTLEKSIQKDTQGSPDLPNKLNNLGIILYDLFAFTKKNEHWQQVTEAFEKAAKLAINGRISEAGLGAQNWMKLAFNHHDWIQVERAYEYVEYAVQELLKIQLLREEKEIWLKKVQGISSQATYALAKNNELQKAVLTIEKGLAYLLSESLELQDINLEQLKKTDQHDLYNRYYKAMAQWKDFIRQSHGNKKIYNHIKSLKQKNKNIEIKFFNYDTEDLTPEQQMNNIRTGLPIVYNELERVINDIQKINDQEKFMGPPSFSDIQKMTEEGTPIVYLLATNAGGLALIVKEIVTAIWLPELTENALVQFLTGSINDDFENSYLGIYNRWQQNRHHESTRSKWYNKLDEMTHWLWQKAILPITDNLSTNTKIALIPVGYLNLLPLHAACIEDNSMAGGKGYLLDNFNIIYTPNARALDRSRKIAHVVSPESLLLIDEPKPVKKETLPNSNFEVQMIASLFADKPCQIIRHNQASLANILETITIRNYSILHFSCHGLAMPHKPLKSGLIMANDEFLSLEKFLKLRLSGIRLITLSACETSISGLELPDEMINLSSGLLQAGSAGVISSLWSVSELSTMMLMSKFYDLWMGNKIDPSEALRKAQIWVRDSTNKEKLNYFKSEELSINIKNPKIAQELVEELEDRIGFLPDDANDFAHPYYWAGFQYIGA